MRGGGRDNQTLKESIRISRTFYEVQLRLKVVVVGLFGLVRQVRG
jgi:hypothetical protein